MSCDKCSELMETLEIAHAAFAREKAKAIALEFENERLRKLVAISEAEAKKSSED